MRFLAKRKALVGARGLRYARAMSSTEDKDRAGRALTWREWLQFEFVDHGILRHVWTNMHEIAPGVWRSNQPGPGRLRRLKQRGFRSVLSLRAALPKNYTIMERKLCRELGLTLWEGPSLASRKLVPLERIRELEARFHEVEKPFVFHCKSGADRTGFAAALYLALIEGRPAEEAMAQLHWRHVHLRRSKAGVLAHVFRAYMAEAEGRDFRTWLQEAYDPARLTADFQDWRKGRGRWAKASG